MMWQDLATSVARAWGRPRVDDRSPGTTLEYMADRAFWAAAQSGFQYSTEEWRAAVQAAYDQLDDLDAYVRERAAREPAFPDRVQAAEIATLDDLEDWFR